MNKIETALLDCGVPAHLSGFRYLADAIEMVNKDITCLDRITIQLYPEIAEKHGTIPTRVERAIRVSVENAFDNMTPEIIRTLFGNSLNPMKGKATNGQFIATMALYLREGA